MNSSRKVAVIGLGYVGLPVALGFAKHFEGTFAFDISEKRVKSLQDGHDVNLDIEKELLESTKITFTSNVQELSDCNFFVVAVPTPIDRDKRPDLRALASASKTVGSVLKKGDIVVYESTVYPGVTEEFCGPILAETSGLTQGVDFKLGYSPERINPGDKEHTLERIIKVVSGEDEESAKTISEMYAAIIDAGVHEAPSIKVAEAAKVIENTQRDLNIALMNELSIIFDIMDISTKDVIEAAGTKWNFLKFFPGLVGGHCIGVDPYYLTSKAEQLGYVPEVILAGRRINDEMGRMVAQKTVKLLARAGRQVGGAKVGVLGITFKENVGDMRNSRVPDIVKELQDFGVEVLVADPLADADEVSHEHAIQLQPLEALKNLDALVVAVSHAEYLSEGASLQNRVVENGVLIDVKSILDKNAISGKRVYWSL